MSQTLVSIVIPTYDRAGFVDTAIASVLEQNYEALELIVIDDGSHDETPKVLARIAERTDARRFRWERQENRGQAATVNRGFEEAKGDLLGYLSSDDYLLPGAITRLATVADEHPSADVVYPWFHVVDLADRIIDTNECLQHTFIDSLRWATCIPGVGALMRRACYERIGGWDTSYQFAPDYEWWLRARDAQFLRVPEVLGAFRSHAGSITANSSDLETIRERIRILDEIYAQDDLTDELVRIKHEAYAAVFITGACILEGLNLGAPGRRFVVEDRLGPLYSVTSQELEAESRLSLLRSLNAAYVQLDNAMLAVDQLAQNITVLEDAARWREQRIVALEAQRSTDVGPRVDACREVDPRTDDDASVVDSAPSDGSSTRWQPNWTAVARALTPPPFRPRLRAMQHRIMSIVNGEEGARRSGRDVL